MELEVRKRRTSTSFRLNDVTRKRLEGMSVGYAMSQGELIELMVSATYAMEFDKLKIMLEERRDSVMEGNV